MKRLSIVIPIYNVEAYLERCLRSILKQDIPIFDYEVICINDGSPDRSKEIVVALQEEFDNIVLINQVNQGVSIARNNGINIAKGKYLLFVDPDDYVEQNSFSRILNFSENLESQVCFLGFTFINQKGNVERNIHYKNLSNCIYSGMQSYFLARGDGKVDPDRMWAILFNREFLNDNKLRFLAEVPYLEDGELIARILCIAERCVFEGNSFYLRTTRKGSATNSNMFYSNRSTIGFLKALRNLKEFKENSQLSYKQREFLNMPIIKFVVLAFDSGRRPIRIGYLRKLRNEVSSFGLRKLQLNSVDKEFRFLGQLYNMSPIILVSYLYLLNIIRYIRYKLYELLD